MQRLTRFAVLAVVVTSAGCVLNRAPILAERDTGGVDTGSFDAGNFDVGRDGGMDAPIDVPPGVDTGIDTGPDVPGLDASFDAGLDSGLDSGMDAGFDTGVDTGIDTGVDVGVDTGVDAGVPDTGVDAPTRPPTCDELFDPTTPGYVNCNGSATPATRCEFYMNPSSSTSCRTMCELVPGASCVDAHDNAITTTCTYAIGSGSDNCGTPFNDGICLCNRP